ncbi:MAG TPA: GNAT family N-acetyltransferase [Jiangellaceae bacterium]
MTWGVLETTSATVGSLRPADLADVLEFLDRDPVTDVFVASRVQSSGLASGQLGGDLWGYREEGRLVAMCYSGANLVPVAASPDAARMFAELAAQRGRRCSSMLGPADAVLTMWDLLRSSWGAAREVRPHQPLLAIADHPEMPADPLVRRVWPHEIDTVLPACIAMFTEEVGVSPVGKDGGAYYRARVAEMVCSGRAFARIEDGEVVFKAEIGAATSKACQVQGVWVRPDRRGQGLCAPGMAAVVQSARRDIAPVVTLYVNDYNVAARSAYRRVGFREIGEFATVLF